jgi:hypothetical protein
VRHTAALRFIVGAASFVAVASVIAGCSDPHSSTGNMPSVKYDPVSGRLKELAFDATQNGRNDAIGFMDGTHVQRIEVDEDEDGKVDRWEFYDADRRLERVGVSRLRNGLVDAMAFYGQGGDVERNEISTRGDGLFNRVEFYRLGSLTRVEEDTNGDRRVDKWETYGVTPISAAGQFPPIATAAFDDCFRGTPTRRLVYRSDGTGVLRVEVDPDGDGVFRESAATQHQSCQ